MRSSLICDIRRPMLASLGGMAGTLNSNGLGSPVGVRLVLVVVFGAEGVDGWDMFSSNGSTGNDVPGPGCIDMVSVTDLDVEMPRRRAVDEL